MKKAFVLLLFIAVTEFAFGQVRVNLNGQTAVTFPGKPVVSKTDSVTKVYSVNLNGGFYIATAVDMSKKPDLSAQSDSLERFYDRLLNTTVKKLNGKLTYRESATINDNKGIEFSYTIDGKSGAPDTRFQHSVYIGQTLFSFAFWTFKDKLQGNTADRDKFFNSISKPSDRAPDVRYSADNRSVTSTTDTAAKSKYSQSTRETLSKAGYNTGYILGAIILTALIIGLFVLIKKYYSKR